ncbi:hypothetical protein [Sphingobium vermicomposti]|uniref:Uncharacterized protein n=1 Tax=Sphingobium vermicomposti TaxID=529005 RepID=A0A846M1A7_9SPHN|nr:hypothetical protein [Sphingobium vermicomposti]NIJ15712.1 hypothetical protein [Sphingobium vermicomposti]
MHTAFSLKGSMFQIELNGQPANSEGLLDWRPDDRLGVVLRSPLSALGASMLMQLVTTAYYDVRPSRRKAPHYAEIYLFHAGESYGDFSSFDVTPHRELFLPADPAALIEAINDRAITHLAVPDGAPTNSTFPWSEPETARDRIRHCFAYAADGRVRDADVAIMSSEPSVRHDVDLALNPMALVDNIERYIDQGDEDIQLFSRKLAQRVRSRINEISEDDKATAKAHHEDSWQDGVIRQTFRKISVDDALSLL